VQRALQARVPAPEPPGACATDAGLGSEVEPSTRCRLDGAGVSRFVTQAASYGCRLRARRRERHPPRLPTPRLQTVIPCGPIARCNPNGRGRRGEHVKDAIKGQADWTHLEYIGLGRSGSGVEPV